MSRSLYAKSAAFARNKYRMATGVRIQIALHPGALAYDKKKLRAVFRAAGSEVAGVARRLMRQSQGGGRVYWPKKGVRHQASAPGQPPTRLSGTLASSVKVFPFKNLEGVAVRDMAFYANFLEAGAKGGGGNARGANMLLAGEIGRRGRILRGKNRMKTSAIAQNRVLLPRPYLSTALAQRADSIGERIKQSILEDIKFVRQKP
jgi:hypothetical protein